MTKNNVVTSFDSHCLNEDKTANHFAPMMTAANNFINQTTNVLPGLNRCDDLFDHSHENSEPIPVSNFDGPAFPQLRKVMTTVADSTQLELHDIDTPRSAVQLTLQNEQEEAMPVKESKYLSHTGCNEPSHRFCPLCKTKKRNEFAQKHLFKSGFQSQDSHEEVASESCSEEEQSCHEADLTDPVSQQHFHNGSEERTQQQEGYTFNTHSGEDEDIDFMFMACADWEQAAEDERNAAIEEESVDN